MRLGKIMKGYAFAHGITQRQLALQVGVAEPVLNRFLNGKPVEAGVLEKIIVWVLGSGEAQPELRRLPKGGES